MMFSTEVSEDIKLVCSQMDLTLWNFYTFLGFGGPECNFEYNECESNPCSNGGTCLDRVGEFQCICPPGFAGSRCQTPIQVSLHCIFSSWNLLMDADFWYLLLKVNMCEPNPCGLNQKCVEHGTGNISCQCIPGLDPSLCAEQANSVTKVFYTKKRCVAFFP